MNQDLDGLLSKLSVLETVWKDDLARSVLELLNGLPQDRPVDSGDIERMLREDFDAAITVVRLFLDRSKDELTYELKTLFADGTGPGKSTFAADPSAFVQRLLPTGILDSINDTIRRPTTWIDVVAERLKAGRGSAIKGQYRGRALEDFVEGIVRRVFDARYDARTSFTGKDGRSTAKSDFAIPSRDLPHILIEVKAFGATGSKQTNVIGDAHSIIEQKRHDTTLLIVTDGISWYARKNDLRQLIALQNTGDIYKIYTKKMAEDLESDLAQMKSEYGI
ncbi:MAG: hypothetical protein EA426_17750 [Spirochaetaceae bacterium]|nr:MAG: hypothetical protein EA426_17750 [Spirochaetaceae bacterium]